MNELVYFLPHYYDGEKKQFVPYLYTNIAQNVMLDADGEETVADAIARLEKKLAETGGSEKDLVIDGGEF